MALYNGDLAAAERFAAVLLDHARELELAGWIARGHCFQGIVLIMRGDLAAGLPLLRNALDELLKEGATPGYTAFLAVFGERPGSVGAANRGAGHH